MTKKREQYWDIIKGLAIIYIVLGHCLPTTWLAHYYVYSFHLAVFVFVTGYLFNPGYINKPFELIGRRLQTLWKPYVIYGTIVLLLHNFFRYVGVYDSSIGYFTIKEYLDGWFHVLFLNSQDSMTGAMWFITALLASVIGYCFIQYFLSRILSTKKKSYWILSTAIYVILGLIGWKYRGHDLAFNGQAFFFYIPFIYL